MVIFNNYITIIKATDKRREFSPLFYIEVFKSKQQAICRIFNNYYRRLSGIKADTKYSKINCQTVKNWLSKLSRINYEDIDKFFDLNQIYLSNFFLRQHQINFFNEFFVSCWLLSWIKLLNLNLTVYASWSQNLLLSRMFTKSVNVWKNISKLDNFFRK